MIAEGSTITSPLSVKTKVCVVGSGAGGALVAMRLAEAGHDVVVVEAGPWVQAARMNQRERDMMRLLYYESGLRTTEDGGMGVLHGRALGGSTVVNYLDCFRTPDRLLDLWENERGLPELTPAKMAPRFDRIFEILHVRKLDVSQLNANNARLMSGANALGWKGDTFHRNANQCYGSGFCDLGCAYNAKQSAAITFIPLATARGARVYTECRVDRVTYAAGRATGVEGTCLDAERRPTVPFRVDADLVVIAGGSVETPFLLLRSGTPDPSGQIGRNLHLHPGTPVLGWFKGERIAAYEGIKQGYYVSEFSWVLEGHETDALIEGVGAPPGLSATAFSGFGAEFMDTLHHFNEFAVGGVLLRDNGNGRVEAGPGRPKVSYTLSPGDTKRLQRTIAASAEAYLAAGAECAITGHNPAVVVRSGKDFARIYEAPVGPNQAALFSFHQMGTARMGDRRDRDAVDPTGRVWEVANLYVADASIFPTASGVNPQITVYALADVVADGILAALG